MQVGKRSSIAERRTHVVETGFKKGNAAPVSRL